VLSGVLLSSIQFSPVVIGLFVFGALILLLYTHAHTQVGELAIFLIWGPIMVSGVYIVLARG
jgi:hypothetical protein